jgi:hypothetical protein
MSKIQPPDSLHFSCSVLPVRVETAANFRKTRFDNITTPAYQD